MKSAQQGAPDGFSVVMGFFSFNSLNTKTPKHGQLPISLNGTTDCKSLDVLFSHPSSDSSFRIVC